VVAVAKRFERRPIESRVGAFPDVSARRTVDLKTRRVEINHGLDLDLRLENLIITGACLSSRKDRVVLYAIRREPSEFEGFVISLEHCRSERKEFISMERRRRNE